MVVMTAALYQWHLEQRALNLQLRRREWDFRDHDAIDPITQLYRAEYWKTQINKLQQSGKSAVIAIIDINNFSLFNQKHGYTEGDRYLHDIAQLVIMNLRQQDLACRYAGDRFAILMPTSRPCRLTLSSRYQSEHSAPCVLDTAKMQTLFTLPLAVLK